MYFDFGRARRELATLTSTRRMAKHEGVNITCLVKSMLSCPSGVPDHLGSKPLSLDQVQLPDFVRQYRDGLKSGGESLQSSSRDTGIFLSDEEAGAAVERQQKKEREQEQHKLKEERIKRYLITPEESKSTLIPFLHIPSQGETFNQIERQTIAPGSFHTMPAYKLSLMHHTEMYRRYMDQLHFQFVPPANIRLQMNAYHRKKDQEEGMYEDELNDHQQRKVASKQKMGHLETTIRTWTYKNPDDPDLNMLLYKNKLLVQHVDPLAVSKAAKKTRDLRLAAQTRRQILKRWKLEDLQMQQLLNVCCARLRHQEQLVNQLY